MIPTGTKTDNGTTEVTEHTDWSELLAVHGTNRLSNNVGES